MEKLELLDPKLVKTLKGWDYECAWVRDAEYKVISAWTGNNCNIVIIGADVDNFSMYELRTDVYDLEGLLDWISTYGSC